MEIYSFSGPSGTGKSSLALKFAHQYEIDAIIDDGLLIINGEVKAGTSAKFEKIMFKAVKRAIFQDDEHVLAVKEALEEAQPQKLLIIGTSDKMTKLIARRLEVGEIAHFHHITEFRTLKQMKMAQFVRKTQGKHIMPVPVVQVQQNFFKRLITKGFEIFSSKREKIGETTIVQPDFHDELVTYEKKDFINQIRTTCETNAYITNVQNINFVLYPLPKVTISVNFNSNETTSMVDKLKELQHQLNVDFDEAFGIEFEKIHLTIVHIRNA